MKKSLLILVVLFIGFYLFTDPNGLARTTKDGGGALWDGLKSLFGALIDFIEAIKD